MLFALAACSYSDWWIVWLPVVEKQEVVKDRLEKWSSGRKVEEMHG